MKKQMALTEKDMIEAVEKMFPSLKGKIESVKWEIDRFIVTEKN